MRITFLALFFLFGLLSCNSSKQINDNKAVLLEKSVPLETIKVKYTESKRDVTVADMYGNREIKDPYRWLEDDNSEETKDWVLRQNNVTQSYLQKIPFRQKIVDRLTKLWNYEKVSAPFKEGDKYYYFRNDGLQNQSLLYATDDLDKEGIVFLDPNKLSADGTSSLGAISFSDDGKYMAYQVSEGGSDWRSISVKDLSSGSMLEDKVDWVKFSGISWAGEGFYYSRYPESDEDGMLSSKNEYHSVYYHKLGTAQTQDVLVYQDKENAQRNAFAGTSDDGRFLVIATSESTSGNGVKVAKTNNDKGLESIVSTFDHDFNFIDNNEDQLLFLTNEGAPKNRLVAIDFNNHKASNWKTIIPESNDALRSVQIIGGKIFASYLHNASSLIKVFDLSGKFIADLKLPGIGTVNGISGKKKENTAFYTFTSFTSPSTIYKLDVETLSSSLHRTPQIDIDLSAYETNQLWFTSKDGTKVPMFVTHKKGLVMDGKRPTLLYGYGGFDIPIAPGFSLKRLPLLENGGIYVVANIRGGGEFGSEWHKAGTLERKQNVFDDFQAAAEFLISENYTSSEKLAIEGRSNGGLLVGACMTQRPDLFKVAFPGVGVLDMLRYHQFTIGWAWAGDYGRSDDPEAFKYLIEYSPLHNVKKVAYPATMVTTADHDDRVVPAHSFKFIAELQHKHQGDNPVLIRIETSAGHGAGKPTSKQIEEAADELSFMFYNFGESNIYK